VRGPLLRVRALSHAYGGDGGLRAVDGVDLRIEHGEALGLIGPSGCGKSTLAMLLVRLLRPASGAIAVDGVDLGTARGRDLARVRRTVQIVFQDPGQSLDPRMSVGASIAQPLAVHGLPAGRRAGRRRARERRVVELLAAVGLSAGTAARRPRELSVGERQRVAIARALALEPRLVILDEPVSSLDPSVGAQVMSLLADLRGSRGLAYLLIAHDIAVVAGAVDRLALMAEGRIVEEAPPASVVARPAHPVTRELVRAAQLFSTPPWG
jgi:ABC-type glutathione transport system ATPase component